VYHAFQVVPRISRDSDTMMLPSFLVLVWAIFSISLRLVCGNVIPKDDAVASGLLFPIDNLDAGQIIFSGNPGVIAFDDSQLTKEALLTILNSLTALGEKVNELVNESDEVSQLGTIDKEKLKELLKEAKDWVMEFRHEHPDVSDAIEAALIGAAIMEIAPAAIGGVLTLLGWGRVGITLRSIASIIQSRYFGRYIPKKSIFAWLTSAAMRGYAWKDIKFMVRFWTTIGVIIAWIVEFFHAHQSA